MIAVLSAPRAYGTPFVTKIIIVKIPDYKLIFPDNKLLPQVQEGQPRKDILVTILQ